MDSIAASLRRERAISLLLPLFFVSGATALIYQTLWARQLHLVFGTSTFAISTVLSAFMAGLAIGGFVMARYADTTPRPLATYGALEIVIGVYAFIFPTMVGLVTPIYLAAFEALSPTPVAFGVIQFLLVGTTLLLPTACMGATLPLLARFATERLGAAGDRVGTLYSVNTAGAVFGTWAAGFMFLPTLGLWNTTILAGVANLVLGFGAIALDMWASKATEGAPPKVEESEESGETFPAVVPVAIAIGLAGFGSLIYEVAWFRLLGLMLGPSTYAFSTMLLAFLIGIAIGGKLGGPLADNVMKKYGQSGVFVAFAGIEVGIAVLSWLLMYTFQELPFWYVWLYDFIGAGEAVQRMWWISLVLAGIVMTPPALLMGAAFPVAVRAVITDPEKLGGPVGQIYGANTLGAVFGAFLAGFVLLPWLHVSGAIFVAGGTNLLAAAILVSWRGVDIKGRGKLLAPIGLVTVGLLIGVARPPWDPMLMTAGMYKYVSHFEDHSREGIRNFTISKYDLLFYEEGISTVVTVAQNRDTKNIWLANNGKVDASTTTDMPTQVLCSLLPVQYSETPDDVLVIGLASGITVGALTLVDDIKRIDVVEIEPAIIEAARLFEEHNHYVLDDPRVTMIANDGRNHVLLQEPGTYDVIVSEPPNPWITGVSNLFTKDFLEMGKTKLKPGGVWSQWVQMYGMAPDDMRTLLHTFASVYPYVALYTTVEDADLVLVGSESPLTPDPKLAQRMFAYKGVKAEMEMIDFYDPLDWLAIYHMDRDKILSFTSDAPLNTDDNMRIEYNAPLNLHRDTQADNMELILKNGMIPLAVLKKDWKLWGDLSDMYYKNDDVRALVTLRGAIDLMPPSEKKLKREWEYYYALWTYEFLGGEEPEPFEPEPEEPAEGELEEGEGAEGKSGSPAALEAAKAGKMKGKRKGKKNGGQEG